MMKNKNRRIIVLVLFGVLSCMACGLEDKFVGTWFNETLNKEILTIKKSENGYIVDAIHGSFPCVKEDHLLTCKMGFGNTVFHVNEDGILVMTTPVGMQFKFRKNKSEKK
jgi:hypothetical protein